ncbi:hypothetical protein ACIQ1H_01085 [Lysinibacillus sp. NPDC097279]|uniref:hypothetical protein n=1 Tax=Lysinibacillus sp. NPDC097279 TaxID=3364143 RepID=UPI00382CE839
MKLNKYLNSNAVKVLKVVIDQCSDDGFGYLDVNYICSKSNLTKSQVIKIINKYLLNKSVDGVILLRAYSRNDTFGDITFIYSELARNLTLINNLGTLLDYSEFYWTEQLIQGKKLSKLGVKYYVK